ncbi:hypothetical protein VNO78_01210 [Psophocarpus tetragonolobus]|uniref:Uncharacterized protein n=1 Tax=Psophocarpus tetragonolobus TaxID=3891 RepID=A0AAN9XUJ1_PSOTE
MSYPCGFHLITPRLVLVKDFLARPNYLFPIPIVKLSHLLHVHDRGDMMSESSQDRILPCIRGRSFIDRGVGGLALLLVKTIFLYGKSLRVSKDHNYQVS